MIPMEPGPEDLARIVSDRRAEMERARAIANYAHSRTGLLTRYIRNLADRVDPTGRQRRELR
jgi:hypothetical protein